MVRFLAFYKLASGEYRVMWSDSKIIETLSTIPDGVMTCFFGEETTTDEDLIRFIQESSF
jgi:hypothetical protein